MNGCNIITLHVALKMYQNWARPKIACGVICCNVNGIIFFGLDQLFRNWAGPKIYCTVISEGKT